MFFAVCLFLMTGGHSALLCAQSSTLMTLEDLFKRAEDVHHGLRIYRMAEEEAEQSVKISRNAMLPTITGEASVSYLGDARLWDRNFTGGTRAPMPHFGNNYALEASQVIYAGGAIRSGISMAKLQQESARLEREKNRQDIRLVLAGFYLELFKLSNQAKVYEQNIAQTHKLIEEINAKHHEGVALKNDVTRYELQQKDLELALTHLRNTMEIINHRLVVALDFPDGTVIGVDTTLTRHLPGLSAEPEWQSMALQSAPSLAQSRTAIEMSMQQEKIVRAERIPTLALFAGDKLDGPITIEVPPINKNLNYWYVGIGLKYDFSSLFKSNKKTKLSRMATQRSREIHLLQEDQVRTEVKEAHTRFTEAFTQYDTRLKSLQLARQNHAVINNRYLNELALITDMLDADNAKLNAELQVVNARIDILFKYYQLQKVCGTL